jgi:hypothetical protein
MESQKKQLAGSGGELASLAYGKANDWPSWRQGHSGGICSEAHHFFWLLLLLRRGKALAVSLIGLLYTIKKDDSTQKA